MRLPRQSQWSRVVAVLSDPPQGASVLATSAEVARRTRVDLVLVAGRGRKGSVWRSGGAWADQVVADLRSGWPGLAVTWADSLDDALHDDPARGDPARGDQVLLVAGRAERIWRHVSSLGGAVLVPARDGRIARTTSGVVALLQESASDDHVVAAALAEAVARGQALTLLQPFLPDPGEPSSTATARAQAYLRTALYAAQQGCNGRAQVDVRGRCWNGPAVRLLTRPDVLGRLLVLDPQAELDHAEVDLILEAGASDILLLSARAAATAATAGTGRHAASR